MQHNTSALKLSSTPGRPKPSSPSSRHLFLESPRDGKSSCSCLFIAAFIGPGQVSFISRNGARIPPVFARPFSRVEYVIGRDTVIVDLMSMMTPAPAVHQLETDLRSDGKQDNMRLAWGITFFGSWLWILILALLSVLVSPRG